MSFYCINVGVSPIQFVDAGLSNKQKRSIRVSNAKARGTHSKADWQSLTSWCGSCVKCGNSSANLEKDHIVPLYQGGCDCINNIQPLCARCNASKGPESTDYRPEGWASWAGI